MKLAQGAFEVCNGEETIAINIHFFEGPPQTLPVRDHLGMSGENDWFSGLT